MKKILSLIFVPTFALFSACSPSNEEQANKLFVESAIKVRSALKESANYNPKEAVAFLEEAIDNCDKILEQFPETNIAVSLVSAKDLRLGSLKYVDLPEKLDSMKSLLKASEDFGVAGELLYTSSAASIKDAFKLLYSWREPTYKIAPSKELEALYPNKFEKQAILKQPKVPELKAKEAPLVVDIEMEDVLALSRQIKQDVDLISYGKVALEKLLKLTENIYAQPNLLQLITPYMPKMKENVAKITLADQRENAYLLLSKIFANMDNPEAASIALFNIKNEELQTQALVYHVNKLIERENYSNAIDLLANIKSQGVKDDMALDISKLLRQNYKIDLAIKALNSCTNKEKHDDALVEICAQVLSDENLADISNFLATNVPTLTDTHVEILSKCLIAIDEEDASVSSKGYLKALALNELVALFAPHNVAYASNLAQLAFDALSALTDSQEKSQMLIKYLDTAMLFDNMDASRLILSSRTQALLSPEELQGIYLKYMVYHYLNGEEKLAQSYLDLIDANIASREKIIVALLKANKSKEEILKVIKG